MRRKDVDKYRTPVKCSYRTQVWDALLKGTKDVHTKHALILTGPEGLEIPILLKRGFVQENLHLVDANAAYPIMARDKNKVPRANIYLGELADVIEKLRKRKVVIDFANLDFCGTLAQSTIPFLRPVLVSPDVFSHSHIAVTFLAARDDKVTTRFLKEEYEGASREDVVENFTLKHRPGSTSLGWGKYQNGKNPMAWVAMELH